MVYFGLSSHSHFLELRNVTPRKHLPPLSIFFFSKEGEEMGQQTIFRGKIECRRGGLLPAWEGKETIRVLQERKEGNERR